ncbi:MAG TPA: 2Fe-2S iron-sulfur cluster-binding protein [Caldisericia bacterium]|nr:2Fe-2S iron-sulfur cluster-binding protein [Caldisericia bacterium]HPB33963.1 2Fe-2S iron-sulfur cluster-binding protein [Caldisericia bacterium]HQL66679.1 2Fe-2S iron-sulfur cluster-binding protein [Caldisericia bacterium]HQN48109.1 2Fe-2S iron-sulfur cluster-binding protein [Caldisericia bacterium]HQO99467.1 2Fe-2S iron-sulfur cluster-binding protein [Caldisericia bacterium]
MEKIKIKINGQEVEVEQGKTVLQVAKELNLHIPTLCNFEPLLPQGSCRICLVEDRGKLVTSCTTQVAPNMDIKLDTTDVIASRNLILQLLFTERNHYCMYCEASGDCELQKLGYEFGLDHFEFETYERKFTVDNSHNYIVIDPNRCVLCRRCVRACSQLAGHNVLGEMNRGIDTMIIADMDVPLGESSCTSCGLCVQVCPTGAITDKRSYYFGKDIQTEEIYSNCDQCPVGCGVKIYKKKGSNFIVKIYGDFDKENEGVLCKLGRYAGLFEEKPRLTSAKIKDDFGFKKIDFDGIIKTINEKMEDSVVYVDGSLFNEELSLIKKVFKDRVFSLYENEPPIESNVSIDDIKNAKDYIVIGVDLNREYGVIGSFIKRKIFSKNGRLILFDSNFNSLKNVANYVFGTDELESGFEKLKDLDSPIVIYKNLSEKEVEILNKYKNFRFFHLPFETNSIGLLKENIKHKIEKSKNIIFIGKNLQGLKDIAKESFTIVFTPYETDEINKFDLLIPINDGFEREGSFYNVDGKVVNKAKVLDSKFETFGLKAILEELIKVKSL